MGPAVVPVRKGFAQATQEECLRTQIQRSGAAKQGNGLVEPLEQTAWTARHHYLQAVGSFEELCAVLVEGAAVVEHENDVRGKLVNVSKGLVIQLVANKGQVHRVFDDVIVVCHLQWASASEHWPSLTLSQVACSKQPSVAHLRRIHRVLERPSVGMLQHLIQDIAALAHPAALPS